MDDQAEKARDRKYDLRLWLHGYRRRWQGLLCRAGVVTRANHLSQLQQVGARMQASFDYDRRASAEQRRAALRQAIRLWTQAQSLLRRVELLMQALGGEDAFSHVAGSAQVGPNETVDRPLSENFGECDRGPSPDPVPPVIGPSHIVDVDGHIDPRLHSASPRAMTFTSAAGDRLQFTPVAARDADRVRCVVRVTFAAGRGPIAGQVAGFRITEHQLMLLRGCLDNMSDGG